MKKRKKAAAPKSRPRKRVAARRSGPKLTVHVIVPPSIALDGPELGQLTANQRLEIATLGTKYKTAGLPTFVSDEHSALWRKALRVVKPHWKRYAFPYSAVAYVYFRMGGTQRMSHPGVERIRTQARMGPMANAARARRGERETRSSVHVERVPLDELGYDERGKYYGTGDPLWRVVTDSEPFIDEVVRAHSPAAARASVLERHHH